MLTFDDTNKRCTCHRFSDYDKLFRESKLQPNKPNLSLEPSDPGQRRAGEDETGMAYMEANAKEDELYNPECPVCREQVVQGFLCLDTGYIYHEDCVILV